MRALHEAWSDSYRPKQNQDGVSCSLTSDVAARQSISHYCPDLFGALKVRGTPLSAALYSGHTAALFVFDAGRMEDPFLLEGGRLQLFRRVYRMLNGCASLSVIEQAIGRLKPRSARLLLVEWICRVSQK